MVEIICYHTCKNEGGKEFILNNAPFYSDNKPKNGKKGKPQWLSEGFYLWTDSDYYAKTWLKENFAIIQFTLTIDKDDLFVITLGTSIPKNVQLKFLCTFLSNDNKQGEEKKIIINNSSYLC